MALFSFSDLTTPVTRAEVEASVLSVLAALGVPTTAWAPGAVVRTMVVGVSAALAALSQLQAYVARSGFLDLSEADWLDAKARYDFGLERLAATYASGTLQLANAGGGLYELAVHECVATNPTTGKSYRNTAAFTLNPGATIAVAFEAVEPGSASNASSGAITELVTTLLNVSVTNLDTFTGLDAERDPALRARARERLGALSPMGPWDAYTYAARNAKRADGVSAGVTRVRTLQDGYGNVDVIVASASGAVGGTLGDLSTDLGAVDDAVQRNAAPIPAAAHTVSATAQPVHVAYELWAYNTAGRTDAQLKAAVQAKLAAFFSELGIGGATLAPGAATGYVFVDALRAAISTAVPEVFHVVLSSPASDVALSATQVATLLHSTSSDATVHQVTPSAGAS